MRLRSVFVAALVFAGIALAQDTNFPVGPQYLITNGSPITLHSIATPSLSLGETKPFEATVTGAESLATELPSTPSAPSETFLGTVYWGEHKGDEVVARRIEAPSMTPSETALYMEKVASQVYGPPAPPEQPAESVTGPAIIEIAGAQLPPNLPASIMDAGVTGMASAESLAISGAGLSLGDIAAYWKARKRTAAYVFTNSDLRPHG